MATKTQPDLKSRVVKALGAGQPRPKPVTRPRNTGPGARPGGPRESGPRTPLSLPGMMDGWLTHLPPDQQAAIRARIAPLVDQIQQHIDGAGSILAFHPSLEHTHGPDGKLMPPIGQGGIGDSLTPPTGQGGLAGVVGERIQGFLGQMSGRQLPAVTGAPMPPAGTMREVPTLRGDPVMGRSTPGRQLPSGPTAAMPAPGTMREMAPLPDRRRPVTTQPLTKA